MGGFLWVNTDIENQSLQQFKAFAANAKSGNNVQNKMYVIILYVVHVKEKDTQARKRMVVG